MIFWAEELIELAKEVSDSMESIEAPKDENGEIIAGTDEVRQFNKYAFALAGAIKDLKRAMKEAEVMKHYAVGKKVFETEDEARAFCRDLVAYGALGSWRETDEEVTHRYCFEGNLRTEAV